VTNENKTTTGDEPDASAEGDAGEEAGHDRDETPPGASFLPLIKALTLATNISLAHSYEI
jgi:hypothetical protein